MNEAEEVIFNGCVVVDGELVGFLTGHQQYIIPNFVSKICCSNYAESYRDTFEDDFIDPTFDLSPLYGTYVNFDMPFKEWLEIDNLELLSFPVSGW